MGCEVIQTPYGAGFACSRGQRRSRCRWCGKPGTKLCDWKGAGARKTCDAPMCDGHAKRIGPDLDHCPDHVA